MKKNQVDKLIRKMRENHTGWRPIVEAVEAILADITEDVPDSEAEIVEGGQNIEWQKRWNKLRIFIEQQRMKHTEKYKCKKANAIQYINKGCRGDAITELRLAGNLESYMMQLDSIELKMTELEADNA